MARLWSRFPAADVAHLAGHDEGRAQEPAEFDLAVGLGARRKVGARRQHRQNTLVCDDLHLRATGRCGLGPQDFCQVLNGLRIQPGGVQEVQHGEARRLGRMRLAGVRNERDDAQEEGQGEA